MNFLKFLQITQIFAFLQFHRIHSIDWLYFRPWFGVFLFGLGANFALFSEIPAELIQIRVLEDFETKEYTDESFVVKANVDRIPEIKMSKNLTSPDLESSTSLLFRFPKGTTDLPIEFRFREPFLVEDYLVDLDFHFYSNGAGGELEILLEDTRFQVHRLKITSLHFSKWKKINLKIGNKIQQDDLVYGKKSPVKILGFLYTPDRSESKNREDLLVMDDILARTIPKMRFLEPNPNPR